MEAGDTRISSISFASIIDYHRSRGVSDAEPHTDHSKISKTLHPSRFFFSLTSSELSSTTTAAAHLLVLICGWAQCAWSRRGRDPVQLPQGHDPSLGRLRPDVIVHGTCLSAVESSSQYRTFLCVTVPSHIELIESEGSRELDLSMQHVSAHTHCMPGHLALSQHESVFSHPELGFLGCSTAENCGRLQRRLLLMYKKSYVSVLVRRYGYSHRTKDGQDLILAIRRRWLGIDTRQSVHQIFMSRPDGKRWAKVSSAEIKCYDQTWKAQANGPHSATFVRGPPFSEKKAASDNASDMFAEQVSRER
ncbi:hypothetical protein AC579_5494 [Pseudocercospora musae]|uniref:Uncharacterized protein n=1 Tax=Pseudocercospora musae TaxID=113226 RepID=A0A139IPQ7_9PEZI|nr:hypothetical protein AC579_5494 [Pseudocercospora musae]